MTRYRILVAALAAIAFAVPPAGAEEASRLILSVRGAWTPSGTGTDYFQSYDPHPEYDKPGSYARQTLQVDPLVGHGLQAGLTFFFGPAFGIRLSLGRDETPFGGANSPFEMSYKYTVWMPGPGGFQFVDGIRNTSTEWPPTSGDMRRTTVGLEAVVRIPLGPSLSLNLSGGPLLSFFGGDIHSLAYSELVYERYGAFFFDTYFVRLGLPAQTVVGLTGGAELSLRIARHLAFVLGAAYRSGSYTGTPEILAAYDWNAVLEAPSDVLIRIKTRIAPGPIALAPSPILFGAGFAVVF